MKHSETKLRLMALQTMAAESKDPQKYYLLMGRVSQKSGMRKSEIRQKIQEMATQ